MARPSPAAASRGLARAGTATGYHRRKGASGRHHQARQQIFAQADHPGARSAFPVLASNATPLGEWLRALIKRVHKNAAVVALANKLARIAWAVPRRGERDGGAP